MKKLLLLIGWFLLSGALLQAQEERLHLKSSSHSRIDGNTGHMMNYVPLYEHKGSTLRADSGYVYTDSLRREYFEAFGNVVITQPSGTMIFANKLHYTAETQLAILTGNVRLVDGNSVLTTNYLTYNMRNDLGTYTNGGRITNETDTITSERAWYFNNTKDAYFRLNVVVRTPDVTILTDTMRYNSTGKTAYFYGPTNIKGKKSENLYTESGYYNTESELAEFYQNNLYTENSRLLRGDTLHYDGKSGDGRALGNVFFVDTADQFYVSGGLGIYNRDDESIMMTNRALVTLVVNEGEEQENIANDSLGVTLENDSTLVVPSPDPKPARQVDSVYLTADTLFSKTILRRDYVPLEFNLDREGGELDDEDWDGDGEQLEPALNGTSDPLGTRDSIPDSLQTDSLQTDSIPDSLQMDSLQTDSLQTDSIPDSLQTNRSPNRSTTPPPESNQYEDLVKRDLDADSLLRRDAVIPRGSEVDSLLTAAALAMNRPLQPDSAVRDSAAMDTSKTRIVRAYRNVRLFKSDLQAVADSAYYGYADSMMRFFGSPMAWTQGSQLSGDSLFLQIKNDQLDNMVILRNAFVANTKQDSTKFNQVKGRRITGFFEDGKLERVFVDGNAENIVYRENDAQTGYTDMYHSRSARIKMLIRENELTDFIPIKSTEGTIYPLFLVPAEREILEGFRWKPGDRPRSKEDLLNRKRSLAEEIIVPETQSTESGESTESETLEESGESETLEESEESEESETR